MGLEHLLHLRKGADLLALRTIYGIFRVGKALRIEDVVVTVDFELVVDAHVESFLSQRVIG